MSKAETFSDLPREIWDILTGSPTEWSERWGRAVWLHKERIARYFDACLLRSITWPELDAGVNVILSGGPPSAPDIPTSFLAEPTSESVPTPQQQDAGGVGCPTFPAPSVVGEGVSSIQLHRLDSSGARFELEIGELSQETGIQIIITRAALRTLHGEIVRALLIPIQTEP